jgi:hypothetical protein
VPNRFRESMHERGHSEQAIGPDTVFSGLLARLERDGMSAQVVSASRDLPEPRPNTVGDRTETRPGEPLTPELVLVDPDLARRARKQLPEKEPEHRRVAVEQGPAAQAPLFGFVQPTPSTHVVDRQHRSRKPPRGGRVLVLLILSVAAAVAILRVEPLKHFFWESREATVVPAGDDESAAGVPRGDTLATPKPGPKPQAGSTQRTAPSRRSAKPKTQRAIPPAAQPPRAFAWVAVPNATYYFVQFYRGGDEIFRARPSAPRLLVPAQWTLKGHRYSLTPGRYRWSVRPGFGRQSQARYGQPVVRAKLVIQRSPGG